MTVDSAWMMGWQQAGRLAAAATLAMGLGLAACSDDGGGAESGGAGVGEACTIDGNCQEGLRCRGDEGAKTCVDPSGGSDTGGVDAGDVGDTGTTDGGGNDTGAPPESEDYVISYTLLDRIDSERSFWVYDTAAETHAEVELPAGVTCLNGCWLTDDLSTLVYAQSNGAGVFDVYKVALDDSYVPQGSPEQVVTGVSRVSLVGEAVTYKRATNGDFTAYYKPLDGGQEVLFADIGSSGTTEGGWIVDPGADQAAIFQPRGPILDVKVGQPSAGVIESVAYSLSARNYQPVGGTYFGSDPVAAFSPDHRYIAFVTEAPNNYQECSTAADCSGPVKRCGHLNRCTAQELTVNVIDRNNLQNLGQPCGGPGTCGEVHECYEPTGDSDDSMCIPKRIVLGLPVLPQQDPDESDQSDTKLTGCELTQDNPDYVWTNVRGPMTFDDRGNLYVAASRECATGEMADSAILRISATTGEVTEVYGNNGQNFDPNLCWDAAAQEVDAEGCVVYVNKARLSPAGNEFAFTATNPNVTRAELADQRPDLWTVLRDGSSQEWSGGHQQRSVVESFDVHPMP